MFWRKFTTGWNSWRNMLKKTQGRKVWHGQGLWTIETTRIPKAGRNSSQTSKEKTRQTWSTLTDENDSHIICKLIPSASEWSNLLEDIWRATKVRSSCCFPSFSEAYASRKWVCSWNQSLADPLAGIFQCCWCSFYWTSPYTSSCLRLKDIGIPLITSLHLRFVWDQAIWLCWE